MKLPRKGILIRLGIYLPIIGGLLVWRACYFSREEVVQPAPAASEAPKGKVRTIPGPNGEEFKVIEITSEQAREMGVKIPDEAPPTDDKAPQ